MYSYSDVENLEKCQEFCGTASTCVGVEYNSESKVCGLKECSNLGSMDFVTSESSGENDNVCVKEHDYSMKCEKGVCLGLMGCCECSNDAGHQWTGMFVQSGCTCPGRYLVDFPLRLGDISDCEGAKKSVQYAIAGVLEGVGNYDVV
eukprot:UN25863